jgi:NAD(P)-dependent dehydrogenase (short-subunit alcohol dehydrogenase family)
MSFMRPKPWWALALFGAAALGARLVARRKTTSFAGRTVAIFGGSRGLGLVLACELAEQGADVVLVARDVADLENAGCIVEDASGRIPLLISADVTLRHEVDRAIERIVQERGRIDVLVNDAGIIQVGPFDHMRQRDYARGLATHLWGPLFTMLATIPYMRAQGGGRIVNIGSIGGRVPVPHLAPYVASKYAATGLSEALGAELRAENIHVTTVSPGLMRTGSYLNVEVKGDHPRELRWFAILGSLPFLSMSARRAARRILRAARRGEPMLTLGLPAKLAVLMHALAPRLFASFVGTIARALPAPRQGHASATRSGWDSRSRLVPSALTALSNRAAKRNNELKGHHPEELSWR